MKKVLLPIFIITAVIIMTSVISLYFPKKTYFQTSILQKSWETLWIPVLVYHHIGTPPKHFSNAAKSLFIEPAWLEKHLQYLQENNFQTVNFSDVAAYFNQGIALPLDRGKQPVIISFDDGWKTAFSEALPLLKKYGMTGTMFLPTNLLGKGIYMNWEQVKKLHGAGMEIGSHSLSHPYLTKSQRAKEEIFESKKILEEKLATTITTFAYPYGNWNAQIENLVKEAGYTTARSFTTGDGISQKNLFHIPVVRVYANVGLERWKKQLSPPP